LLDSGKGGSIANVAYNPCGVLNTSQMLAKEFLQNVLWHGERCLGRAVFAAKCSVIARNPDDDNIYGPAVLWTLFGDPALRVKHRILTGVEEGAKPQAPGCNLTVSPNPARTSLAISYALPVAGPVSLRLYDESGVLVRTVLSGHRDAGTYVAGVSPSVLKPGIYFVRLEAGRTDLVQKFAVVR
jgi:hypothetical protein